MWILITIIAAVFDYGMIHINGPIGWRLTVARQLVFALVSLSIPCILWYIRVVLIYLQIDVLLVPQGSSYR